MPLELFAYRSDYELGARSGPEEPLCKIRSDLRRDEWYRIASGKGVLLLHALRQHIDPACSLQQILQLLPGQRFVIDNECSQ